MQVQQSRAASACSCSGRLQLVATPSCRPFTGRAMSQRGPAQQRATAAAAALEFAKYQGLGNDFILVHIPWLQSLLTRSSLFMVSPDHHLCNKLFLTAKPLVDDGTILAMTAKTRSHSTVRPCLPWRSHGAHVCFRWTIGDRTISWCRRSRRWLCVIETSALAATGWVLDQLLSCTPWTY